MANKIINNAFDFLFNKRIKGTLLTSDCTLILGQKRVGKSTLSAMACDYYKQMGYTCLSNYPIENSLALPMVEKIDKKDHHKFYTIDKTFLYDTDLRGCAIFIDEGANYWPARGFATDWTYRDTEFFTMAGKRKIKLFINVQYYDLIDLNVKRACDTQFFLSKNQYFKSFTNCHITELVTLPVANLNAPIVAKGHKNAYQVSYQLCEEPLYDCHFYRPPYYDLFTTEFDYKIYDDTYTVNSLDSWNDIFNFDIGVEPV